jgi:energy-coupling factor transporter ATP-binding protein EcfA2
LATFNFAKNVKKATRVSKKARIFLTGPQGTGKTLGSLLLAKGIVRESKGRVIILDTENGRASLKVGCEALGDFEWDTIEVDPGTVTSELVSGFLKYAEKEGYEVAIVDSLTHAWEAVKKTHDNMPGNSFTNWGIAKKPFHDMLRLMIGSKLHVIMTSRAKQVYEQGVDSGGKKVVNKLGLASQVEDNTGYEFDLIFRVLEDHRAYMDKTEGGLFESPDGIQISEETGAEIISWLSEGEDPDARRKRQFISRILELLASPTADAEVVSKLSKTTEEYMSLSLDELQIEGARIKTELGLS